jgi:hypothetical protein
MLTFKLAGGDELSKREAAYAESNGIATEAISNVRTVASFSGEVKNRCMS